MIEIIENANLNWQEIKAPLQLNKSICMGWCQKTIHVPGHFSDYLDGEQPLVALRAHKDSSLVLWDSASLIPHCAYNDALQVGFQVLDNLQDAASMNVETWSGNNGFIVRGKDKGCDITYYFSLLHSHALTGELLVSPCFYFIDNPNFILGMEAHASISELFKTSPLVLNVKENQMICFDKFHYQMKYNNNFSFMRLSP